jgi:rubrerythrin
MEQNSTLEILKQAILLEKRGKVFYTNAAENSKDPDVKKIFEIMASEEDEHVKFLSEQFHLYRSQGKFDFTAPPEAGFTDVADEVITKSISDKVSAVSFEATAISMAIDMENRAIAAYSKRAGSATDPDEKAFYLWLADWERGHHKILYYLDQQLKEKIWTDNSFWPF